MDRRGHPFVPNKRFGGVCLGTKIAPIFYNTMEDAGALPIELDVSKMDMGDVIELRPYDGKALKNGEDRRIHRQVRRDLRRGPCRRPHSADHRPRSDRPAREALGLPPSTLFRLPATPASRQGLRPEDGRPRLRLPEGKGIRPGTYCEPKMTTVGSQDTTGPMTRDELKDLACLGFSADLVMQSFCHTAAYPKLVDVKTHQELPAFISTAAASACGRVTASSIPG